MTERVRRGGNSEDFQLAFLGDVDASSGAGLSDGNALLWDEVAEKFKPADPAAAHNALATAHGVASGFWGAAAGAVSPSGTNILMTRSAVAPWLGLTNVMDYEATGDGVADDTAEVQAAINAAISQSTTGRGGSVIIPPGLYDIYDTLTITGVVGFNLTGSGRDSILRWRGAADRPLLSIVDAQQVSIRDLEIDAATALDAGIRVWRSGAVNPANRKNRFENVVINDATHISDGIVIGGAGTYDANNDFNLLINCFVSSNRYNYAITGAQSFGNMFINCDASGGINGLRVGAGYFEWIGGSCAEHSDYDFYVENGSYITFRINGVNCERSKRFVYWNSAIGSSFDISNCRWSATHMNADGIFINLIGNGHIRMSDNLFGDGMSGASVDPLIRWYSGRSSGNTYSFGSSFEFVGNIVITDTVFGGVPPNPFSLGLPTDMRDNKFQNENTADGFTMPRYPNTLTTNDTTPDIENSAQYWLEANSNPTSVTDFLNGTLGKIITIEFTTGNTTIVAGAPIRLAGGVDFVGSQYDTLTLYHNGTCWIEVGRSVNA